MKYNNKNHNQEGKFVLIITNRAEIVQIINKTQLPIQKKQEMYSTDGPKRYKSLWFVFYLLI